MAVEREATVSEDVPCPICGEVAELEIQFGVVGESPVSEDIELDMTTSSICHDIGRGVLFHGDIEEVEDSDG